MKNMTTMMLGLLIALSAGLMACEKKAEEPAKAEEAKTETKEEAPAEEPKEVEKPEAGEELAMVEVTKEGTKFDPPVKPEQIPEGAWYCDMGTVEYAALEKGDGKCPVCGMMLKQKTAGAAADGAAGDHHGHDHDGHEGHDHDGHEGHDH